MSVVDDKVRAYRQQIIEELTPRLHLLPTIELVRLLLWAKGEAIQGHGEREMCKKIARRAKKGKPQQQRFPELRMKMCDPLTRESYRDAVDRQQAHNEKPGRTGDGVTGEKPPEAVVQDLEKTFRPE